MAAAETMYVKSGEVDIAYQVEGDGPIDLMLFSPWVIPMDAMDEEPSFARVLQRLASFGRLIRFDRRGVGLSDPVSRLSPPTLEQWMADALAVMDAVHSERAALLGLHVAGGGPVATLLAASHPE